jgi:hypothetical protein
MATFSFANPSGSAYFTLELKRDSDGFYPTSSAQTAYISGSSFTQLTSSVTNPIVAKWTTGVTNGMGDVNGGYIWSIVVPPGSSSVVFTPGATIPVSESIFRGTGEYVLTLTT